MAHYGTLRDYHFVDNESAADDIRGSKVYGINDEKLGKIDDVIFDHSTGQIRYVVVDTGGWLSSKKFIVPPDRLQPSAEHKDDFRVDLSKEQIESFPPYNESDVESEKKWGDYENRYRSKWEENPVMHRLATDRNITPTTKQQVQSGAGRIVSGEEDTGTSVTPMRTEAAMDITPSGPGRRWTTFEERLRKRRNEIVSRCTVCGTAASPEKTYDRSRDRKVS